MILLVIAAVAAIGSGVVSIIMNIVLVRRLT